MPHTHTRRGCAARCRATCGADGARDRFVSVGRCRPCPPPPQTRSTPRRLQPYIDGGDILPHRVSLALYSILLNRLHFPRRFGHAAGTYNARHLFRQLCAPHRQVAGAGGDGGRFRTSAESVLGHALHVASGAGVGQDRTAVAGAATAIYGTARAGQRGRGAQSAESRGGAEAERRSGHVDGLFGAQVGDRGARRPDVSGYYREADRVAEQAPQRGDPQVRGYGAPVHVPAVALSAAGEGHSAAALSRLGRVRQGGLVPAGTRQHVRRAGRVGRVELAHLPGQGVDLCEQQRQPGRVRGPAHPQSRHAHLVQRTAAPAGSGPGGQGAHGRLSEHLQVPRVQHQQPVDRPQGHPAQHGARSRLHGPGHHPQRQDRQGRGGAAAGDGHGRGDRPLSSGGGHQRAAQPLLTGEDHLRPAAAAEQPVQCQLGHGGDESGAAAGAGHAGDPPRAGV
eukprot:ctg_1865.g530